MSAYNQNRTDNSQGKKIPSIGKVIAKVAIGCFIIIVGLDEIADITQFLLFLVLGLAFIAWGILPYIQAKREAKQEAAIRILETPFPGEKEKDAAEILAEKYYNK